MIKKYEDACKKEGLSEEKIREIRQLFDAEKKRLKRRKNSQLRNGMWFYSINNLPENCDGFDWELQDMNADAEEMAIHNNLLEQLDCELSILDDQDRELLLSYFDPKVSFSEYSRQVKISRLTLISRKDRLVEMLKKKLGVK